MGPQALLLIASALMQITTHRDKVDDKLALERAEPAEANTSFVLSKPAAIGRWSTTLNSSSRFASDGNSSLQVLWEDAERVFCRGNSHGDDTTPVLAVLPATEHPAPAVLNRLAHEYELRDELDAGWAARPLELVREHGQTILLLKDPGGEPLDRLIGPPMEIGKFLRLAVALSAALGRLHGRGLIHKDIKPSAMFLSMYRPARSG